MKQVNENGFWRIENNPISQVGVFPYLGKNISDKLEPNKIYFVYRPAEELFAPETLESFNSTPLPLVDEHEMLGDGATPAENKGIHGVISNVRQDGKLLVGDISIYSETMKDEINRGKKDLSMGYYCEYDLEEGDYEGQHYDAVQRNLRGNHVALVDQGRCGHSVRVYDHFALDADFKEDEHPRKKDGKFAPKGQGEATGGNSEPKEEKIKISQNQNERRKSTVERARNVGEKNRKTINDFDSEEAYQDFIHAENSRLTFHQRNAIENYTGTAYDDINRLLRGQEIEGNKEDAERNIGYLTKACEHKFRYDQILYRGTGLAEVQAMLGEQSGEKLEEGGISTEELKKELVGKIYEAKSFVSTTTHDNLSELLITLSAPVELKIIAPAGTEGLDLTFDSTNGGNLGGEQEVLLQRGTKFEITNVSEHSDRLQIEMSVVIPEDYHVAKFDKDKILSEISDKTANMNGLKETVDRLPISSQEDKKEVAELMAQCEAIHEKMLQANNSDEKTKIIGKYRDLESRTSQFERDHNIPYLKMFFDEFADALRWSYRSKEQQKIMEQNIEKLRNLFEEKPTSIDSYIELEKATRANKHFVSSSAWKQFKNHLLEKLDVSNNDYEKMKETA